MTKNLAQLDELRISDKGLLINEGGKKVNAIKIGSGELIFYPGECFPVESPQIPDKAQAYVMGRSRDETQVKHGLPGISTHYTTTYTKIDYYQIKDGI